MSFNNNINSNIYFKSNNRVFFQEKDNLLDQMYRISASIFDSLDFLPELQTPKVNQYNVQPISSYFVVPSFLPEPSAPPFSGEELDALNASAPSDSKVYQMYVDNWSGQMPPVPNGMTEVEAFAVIDYDGSFDPQYPITVPTGAIGMGLAIGGWYNSQSTTPPYGPNGFYTLVNGIDPTQPPGPVEQKFLDSIGSVLQANPQAWGSITLDFENYDHTLDPKKYTKLVLDVQKYLDTNFPHVNLQIAISPNKKNRDYYDIKALSQAGITFQVMFYDYAMGQNSGAMVALPNSPLYGPSGQEMIATDIAQLVQVEGIPQSQILVGIPGYGITYSCARGLTPTQVQQGIDNWSLQAYSYATSNGQITDDQILSFIGDWDTPNASWQKFTDKFANIYYYNAQSGQIIGANPPFYFRNTFVPFIKNNYPDVQGFFEWEEVGNTNGILMLQEVKNDMSSAPSFMKFQGDSCYIDMGILYGSYILSNCVDWWPDPVHIDQAKVDQFLNAMFAQLKKEGVNKVELAFAQICDIDNLYNEKAGYSTDTITPIFKDNYPVGTGPNFLHYFIQSAHTNEIAVDLSFGGALADSTSMKLNDDPVTAATKLAAFMDNYDLDAVDFDIESPAIMQVNSPQDVVTFFKTLHTKLASQKMQSILTVEGSIQNGPAGVLKPLFDNFKTLFDGVNLMLYSSSQYYLDADNQSWGIKEWLSYIKDPSIMHIGFYDSIAYENPDASAGEKYNIPANSTRGQAAAFVYTQLLSDLQLSLDQVGQPFWWTDNPTSIATNQVPQDFFNQLNKEKS